MITRDSNYIGGQWRLASGSERFEVTDSATEEIIGTVTAATSADADAAVAPGVVAPYLDRRRGDDGVGLRTA